MHIFDRWMPTASEMASDDCIAFVFSDQDKTLTSRDLTGNEAGHSHPMGSCNGHWRCGEGLGTSVAVNKAAFIRRHDSKFSSEVLCATWAITLPQLLAAIYSSRL